MIIARDLRKEDIKPIDDIFQKQPELGVPSSKYMIVNAVMEDTEKKKVLAYGAVKIFAEAVLIMDKSISKKDKAKALIEAMQTAILYARDAGVEILYANAEDPEFGKVLEHRYLFKRVPGALYCLNLDDFED